MKTSKELIELFESLNDERKTSLSDFADYLFSLGDLQSQELAERVEIERPEKETVVGAIKRLKLTYPMIENMTVFSSASSLMTEHMVSGRDVVDVIDEMEVIFNDAYENLLQDQSTGKEQA